MRKNLTINFQLKTNKVRRDGKLPIYLRITIDSERMELATGRYIEKEKWDNRSQVIKSKSEEAKENNNYLADLRANVLKQYNYLIENDYDVNCLKIKEKLEGKKNNGKKLIDVFQENNLLQKREENIKYTSDTIKRYEISIERLKKFLEIDFKNTEICINELDQKFIKRYEAFLRIHYNCSHNTAMKYLKHLKKVIHGAIAYGYIDNDPFIGYKTAYKEVDRGYLTAEELNRIEEKKLRIKRLDQVRDVFLFVCYTGLSYSDLKVMTPVSITKGIDGKNWVVFNRKKTGVRSSIPILPKAQSIIDKYKNDPECVANKQLLPVRSNQKLNSYLSEIAELCEIDKHVTMHLGRHTFATTVTLTNGVPIETVQKMLGHRNLSTTQIYSKVVDTKISEDMEKLVKRIC